MADTWRVEGLIVITAYCGANGAGKTMLAVDAALKQRKRTGRPLYSTVAVYEGGEWVEDADGTRTNVGGVMLTRPITSWEALLEVRDGDVLLDEVSTLAAGRETMTLPPQVLAWMGSLRHRKTMLTWTAPMWNDADVKLRGITSELFMVYPLIRGKRAPGDPWRRTVVSVVRRFDTQGREGVMPTQDQRRGRSLVRLRGLESFGRYDTYADVERLTEYGSACVKCGGRIVRPVCKCPR